MDRIDAMRLFVRVAERTSFSGAARDLKIKQSTASKWIAELERQLRVGLIDRTTRALHLTDAGRQFLAHCERVLGAYDEMTHELDERSPEPSGRVRVSAPAVFGRLFVVPPVIEFLRAHRDVEIELVFNDRYVNLVEEAFDLAVRVGVPTDTSARGRKLADSQRRLVASPAYLRSHGTPVTPKDLARHECLVHGDAAAPTVWRFGRDRGPALPVPIRGRVTANNSEAVLAMARRGLGIALLADWLVERDLENGVLVSLLDGFRAPPAPIYALTPATRYASPAVRALIDHVAASLAPRLGSSLAGGRAVSSRRSDRHRSASPP